MGRDTYSGCPCLFESHSGQFLPLISASPGADLDERSRRYGIRDGAFQAVMVGGGENYLSAFALLLHASAFQIGLLSALPQIVGTWVQLLSVKVLNRFHHRKAIILVGAAGQAMVWLPLLVLPLVFLENAPWLLVVCAVA